MYQASFLFDQRVGHLSIPLRCFASWSTNQTLDTINKWHYAVSDCVTIDVVISMSLAGSPIALTHSLDSD